LTEYRHDALGQVTEVIRHPLPGSADAPLVTAFEYDVLGRLTARETAEHRTEYRHNTLSLEIRRATRAEWRQALLEEREPAWDAVLIFTRNAAGELVSEENHGGKFEYEYDALGNLSSTTFPDGRELATLRYGTGHLLEMQLRHGGTTHTLAAYGRDRLHREISRSQGVLSQETRYDSAGRVTQRTVLDARRELVFERRYRWDRTDQIVQQIHTDTAPATPGEKYSQYLWGYDAAGQVTKAVGPQKEESFFWDPAGNRTEKHRSPVWHNLLLRLDGLKLDYDGFGRLIQRRDKSGVIQHFAYDDEQRVKEITFTGHAEFKKVEYRYDPLGRRTHKILWRYGEKDPETIRFDWQGLQLAGEQSDREPDHYVQYVYTEGSYEPLARIDSVFDDCEIYWYHTELNGLPERVTDADGQTVWRGQFSTWGETERELSVPQWQVPQNLRFQGQYLDRESGLHYNLFRYYDPVAGRYTQMDPIGLLGGMNTYSYVGDPLSEVDPLGLSPCNVNPRLQDRLSKWKDYKANGGQMSMKQWVGHTRSQPWGHGSRSGYGDWVKATSGTVHGNSRLATGLHDVYVIREAGTNKLLHFGETGRGYLTRFAEHQKRFNALGIDVYSTRLATVEGKAAARALELRYIKTYERIFGEMPPYNPVYH
ncbi:RHS repeat-associated core domain-containing protein, partial [Cronobacter malonaticus]